MGRVLHCRRVYERRLREGDSGGDQPSPARAARVPSSELGGERARRSTDSSQHPLRLGRLRSATARDVTAWRRNSERRPIISGRLSLAHTDSNVRRKGLGEEGLEEGREEERGNETVVWHEKRASAGSGWLVWGESGKLSGMYQGQPLGPLSPATGCGRLAFPAPG